MKRFVLALFSLIVFCVPIRAAQTAVESPIGFVGGPFVVQCSTSAWTKVDVATGAANSSVYQSPVQSGLILNNRSTNNKPFGLVISDVAPSVSTNTWPVEIQPGENPLMPIGAGLFLYCVSQHTSAEPIFGQYVRQLP